MLKVDKVINHRWETGGVGCLPCQVFDLTLEEVAEQQEGRPVFLLKGNMAVDAGAGHARRGGGQQKHKHHHQKNQKNPPKKRLSRRAETTFAAGMFDSNKVRWPRMIRTYVAIPRAHAEYGGVQQLIS